MPKGPKGEKRPRDVVGNAVHVMKILTGEIEEPTEIDDSKEDTTRISPNARRAACGWL